MTLPICAARGCREYADPRFYLHMPDGKVEMACDGHGNPGCDGRPCTCPPGQRRPDQTVEAILLDCLRPSLVHKLAIPGRTIRVSNRDDIDSICTVCGENLDEKLFFVYDEETWGVRVFEMVCSGVCALFMATIPLIFGTKV